MIDTLVGRDINPSVQSGIVIQSVIVGTQSGILMQNMSINPAFVTGWRINSASGTNAAITIPNSTENGQAIVLAPGETLALNIGQNSYQGSPLFPNATRSTWINSQVLAAHDTITVRDGNGVVLAQYSY